MFFFGVIRVIVLNNAYLHVFSSMRVLRRIYLSMLLMLPAVCANLGVFVNRSDNTQLDGGRTSSVFNPWSVFQLH